MAAPALSSRSVTSGSKERTLAHAARLSVEVVRFLPHRARRRPCRVVELEEAAHLGQPAFLNEADVGEKTVENGEDRTAGLVVPPAPADRLAGDLLCKIRYRPASRLQHNPCSHSQANGSMIPDSTTAPATQGLRERTDAHPLNSRGPSSPARTAAAESPRLRRGDAGWRYWSDGVGELPPFWGAPPNSSSRRTPPSAPSRDLTRPHAPTPPPIRHLVHMDDRLDGELAASPG